MDPYSADRLTHGLKQKFVAIVSIVLSLAIGTQLAGLLRQVFALSDGQHSAIIGISLLCGIGVAIVYMTRAVLREEQERQSRDHHHDT